MFRFLLDFFNNITLPSSKKVRVPRQTKFNHTVALRSVDDAKNQKT